MTELEQDIITSYVMPDAEIWALMVRAGNVNVERELERRRVENPPIVQVVNSEA